MVYMFAIFCTILFIFSSLHEMHMLQQNSYNDLGKYQKFISEDVKKNWKSFALKTLIIFYFMISINIKLYDIIIFILVLLALIIDAINNFKNHNEKLPIKYTKRLIRIMVLDYFIYILSLVIGLALEPNLYATLLLIMVAINPSILIFIINILKPVEKIIFNGYKKKALEKLNRMSDLRKIGITGSFGKTSTKMCLNSILETTYKGFYTPASFNTPNGITITINNEPTIFNEYFIAEMGAKHTGEIKELADIVNPKYGIITSIGAAHLESFKTMENICNTKFELIESLPEDGLAILNKDDKFQCAYEIKNKTNVKWIGINNKADYMAKNIRISNKGTTFEVVTKTKKFEVTTILLGIKNVYNILEAIALSMELGVSKENIIKGVSNIPPINHRLEIKETGNITIIDDSFNSNPEGAKNAVEVLGSFEGPKYIITPGMVEMGDKEKELNKEFGKQIASVADKVFLVGPKQTKPIYEGLEESKYNKDNIRVCKSFKEAYDLMKQTSGNKKITVLFENDLPDSYKEK